MADHIIFTARIPLFVEMENFIAIPLPFLFRGICPIATLRYTLLRTNCVRSGMQHNAPAAGPRPQVATLARRAYYICPVAHDLQWLYHTLSALRRRWGSD